MPRGGLYQGSSRPHGLLQGAWRRPTVSRGGLHQVSCSRRRHEPLRGARWGTAVPRGGLCQGSCSRRHAKLPVAWWRPSVSTVRLLQPRCCTQRVLQALPKGGVTKRCTGDSTASAAHCCTGGIEQSGQRQHRARVPAGPAAGRRGIECGAAPRLVFSVQAAPVMYLRLCHCPSASADNHRSLASPHRERMPPHELGDTYRVRPSIPRGRSGVSASRVPPSRDISLQSTSKPPE